MAWGCENHGPVGESLLASPQNGDSHRIRAGPGPLLVPQTAARPSWVRELMIHRPLFCCAQVRAGFHLQEKDKIGVCLLRGGLTLSQGASQKARRHKVLDIGWEQSVQALLLPKATRLGHSTATLEDSLFCPAKRA